MTRPSSVPAAVLERVRSQPLLAGTAVLCGLVAFHLQGVLAGGTLFLRDINMVWLPQVESLVRCAAAGSWPLWDDYSAFGRPLLADPRAEVFYPPAWINLALLPATAYGVFTAAHLVWAGLGCVLLARRYGQSWLAAVAAGGLWMTSGPLLSLVSMWHHLAGAAWMPWLVLAVHDLLERPGGRRVVTAAGVAAVQLLAGSPDFSVLTGAFAAAAVALTPRAPKPWASRRAALCLIGAVALSLGLCAVQWLPTLDAVRRSNRAIQPDAATLTWSVHPLRMAETIVPLRWTELPATRSAAQRVLGGKEPWLHSIYLGSVAGVLAIAGLVLADPRRRAPALILAATGLVALGDHGPLGPLLTGVPGLREFRYPSKALVPCALAWSLLAGLGLDALRAGAGASRRAALFAAGALAVLELAAWGAVSGGWAPDLFVAGAPAEGGAALLAAALLAVTGLAAIRAPRNWWVASLAVLCLADVSVRHRDLNPTADRALFGYRPDTLALLDLADGARTYVYDYSVSPGGDAPPPPVWPYELARMPVGWTRAATLRLGVHEYLNPPTAARWGVAGSFDFDILDFDPPALVQLNRTLRRVQDTPDHLRLLQIGAVRNAVALVPMPWWNDLQPAGSVAGYFREPIRVFRVPDPLRRAYLVDGVRPAGPDAVAGLLDGRFDFRREVLLDGAEARPAGEAALGSASVLERTCGSVDVAVDSRRPAHLVMVDAYDPGWHARVDGAAAPLLRANGAFRAVPVPAGTHDVALSYRPRGLVAGLWASLLSLVVAAVAGRRR